MELWQSILLGVVQGLGEFLPISSSAHLVIVPWLFDFKDPGLTFDVALHFGTLIALLAYFYKDWIHLIKAAFSSISNKRYHFTPDENLFWFLVFASIPGAIIGKLLEEHAETSLRSPLLIALMMTLMGIILLWVEGISKKNKSLKDLNFPSSFLIGISQALAIIPGVSRSGVTITAGLSQQLNRTSAARFSFLLATPITFGACLLKLKPFLQNGLNLESLIGIAVSALVGFVCIKYMLAYLQKYSYRVFVMYRFLFAILILVVHFSRKS